MRIFENILISLFLITIVAARLSRPELSSRAREESSQETQNTRFLPKFPDVEEDDGSNSFTSTSWFRSSQSSAFNGRKAGRSIVTKRSVRNGITEEQSREQVLNPDGTVTVVKKVDNNGKVKVRRFIIDQNGQKKELPRSEDTEERSSEESKNKKVPKH